MKKLITTTLIIIFLVSTGMSQVFDGVSISGDFNTALQKFKSKGYVAEIFPEGAILSGKVASTNIEVLYGCWYNIFMPNYRKEAKTICKAIIRQRQTNFRNARTTNPITTKNNKHEKANHNHTNHYFFSKYRNVANI